MSTLPTLGNPMAGYPSSGMAPYGDLPSLLRRWLPGQPRRDNRPMSGAGGVAGTVSAAPPQAAPAPGAVGGATTLPAPGGGAPTAGPVAAGANPAAGAPGPLGTEQLGDMDAFNAAINQGMIDQAVNLSLYEDKLAGNQELLDANAGRRLGMPDARQYAGIYTSANPLEFLAKGIRDYQTNKEQKKLMQERGVLRRDQGENRRIAGRNIFDLVGALRKTPKKEEVFIPPEGMGGGF